MATLSRVKMNKARHKEGFYSKQRQEARKKTEELSKKKEEIGEKEHEKRLKKLKEIGLIK